MEKTRENLGLLKVVSICALTVEMSLMRTHPLGVTMCSIKLQPPAFHPLVLFQMLLLVAYNLTEDSSRMKEACLENKRTLV